ncbi:hypothetical protein G9A89_012882 [Geosiphon pyriformis]|nr:hypothetical protein G9A89_012882 [Geosiphon pyriformis]
MTARLNLATMLRKKLGKPLEDTTTINLIESLFIIQRTPQQKSSDQPKPSDTIPSNQHRQHQTKTFNFYINEKIFSLLGTLVNIESARETFYKELIQNTNLPTNHNFAFIITKINKEIEHHTQQRYPTTYTTVTPKKIQPPAWKKNRVESLSNPFYHYTPGSTINISSTDAFSSTATSAFGQFLFQSRQRKTELLGPYGEYFEGFNSQSSTPSGLQSPPPPPDFGISDLWKAAESEKEEEKSEDQEFTYQHPITENLEVETPNLQTQQQLENPEIKTPNIRMPPNQRNQKPELINQQNLPSIIFINQLPINSIPPQPPNLDPMAYAPIAKLDNFMGKKDDAQIWLNNSLINKPQDFNAFKAEFLRYFSNNNSINRLVNTFTTMKQGETEAILNQFICGLCSSILQHVRPLHPGTLQDAVTCTRDFESAESETNYAQAINLVMNRSSELDSKLENLHNDAIIKETLIVSKINHIHLHQPIDSGNRKRISATIVVNKDISKLIVAIPNFESVPKSKPTHLPTSNAVISLSVSSISTSDLLAAATSNISTTATNNLSTPTDPNTAPKLTTQRNSKTENDSTELEIGDSSPSTDPQFFTAIIWIMPAEFGLLVTPEDALTNNPAFTQKQLLTSNILPTTIIEDKSLAAIFSFEFEETAAMPLFSGAALEAKLITTMYTNAKVKGQSIKLILDSSSADSIITRQLMDQLGCRVDQAASARIITANGVTKTPISKINDFPFEVNDIMTLIKVLVMKTTQYQALVGNDWLSKVNATLDWNTQELQLMYQGQHIHVLAMCGHFKTPPREKLLIKLEEKKEKPT